MKFTQLLILCTLLGIIFAESSPLITRINNTTRDMNHEQQNIVDNYSILHVNTFTDEESTITQSIDIPHGTLMKNNTFGKYLYEAHLPTVENVVNDYMEKSVEQTVDNIGSMHGDKSDSSNWINVSYTSSTFGLEAQIQVALLKKLKSFYNVKFINISLLDVQAVEGQSNKIHVTIDLQASFTKYRISVTMTRNDTIYMWSCIQLYDGQRNYTDQMNRFQTKVEHSYRCDAPDTIVLENRAAIFIRNFYYRAFIDGKALKQVDGCQGSFTYTLYGVVGACCVILICITIVTVIIKYRQWNKERIAYENMDRRFRP